MWLRLQQAAKLHRSGMLQVLGRGTTEKLPVGVKHWKHLHHPYLHSYNQDEFYKVKL
jgi:hypothetical protein